MRPRMILAIAACAVLAVPAAAAAGGKHDDNRGKGHGKGATDSRWSARASIEPTATGENARGDAFMKQRDGALTIALKVRDLDPNTRYASHIHQGVDCASNGAVVLPLPDLITDEHGTVRLWITLATPAGANFATSGYYVNIHPYADATTPGAGITCGEIEPRSTRAKARVRPSAAGSEVEGKVWAKQVGTSLQVEIRLEGLVAGSVHAQHVHIGSCSAQGAVSVPLPDATADSNGKYTAIHTVAAPAGVNVVNGGYYYNLHAGSSAAAGDGIACGDLRATSKKHGKHGWGFGPHGWRW